MGRAEGVKETLAVVARVGAHRRALLEANDDSEVIAEKLMAEHATVGVVAALNAGFAYSALQSPPETSDETIRSAFAILASLSGLFNLTSVLTSTYLFVVVNVLPKSAGREVGEALFSFLAVPARLFLIGTTLTALAQILFVAGTYESWVWLTVTCSTAVLGLLLVVFLSRTRHALLTIAQKKVEENKSSTAFQ
eukprot:CAMPEP_0170142586 /NCGR_PEP_ID=MMETSP0033_2-20121228/7723_1 /TAXON_ID=195969 /ORGANISM="Dolichomastix tenuilepis, Strain CCMP3274" /LENGTH=193 /DNA_ID=CAMNT_0010378931 /DNA_START=54 /DNA_END=635 /DNA_ORIENTATION=-